VPKRTALYAWVSTADQTCEMQLRELREYAGQRGWQILDEDVDTGWSGAKASRPELDRLMQDARRRRFDPVVWKLGRWGRSVADCVRSLQELASLHREEARSLGLLKTGAWSRARSSPAPSAAVWLFPRCCCAEASRPPSQGPLLIEAEERSASQKNYTHAQGRSVINAIRPKPPMETLEDGVAPEEDHLTAMNTFNLKDHDIDVAEVHHNLRIERHAHP
jgi:hypothetical protein